jgi:hypothetical protein
MSTVTMADLEAAQAQVRACLAGAGYDVVVILPGDGLRPTQYTFLGNITDQAGIEAANAAQAACRAEYSDAITEEWGKQQSPPTTAQLEDLHGRLLACVAKGGNASLMDALSGHGTPRGLSAFVAFRRRPTPQRGR